MLLDAYMQWFHIGSYRLAGHFSQRGGLVHARARIAWKKKQLQLERRGDLVFVDAATEYREVRKIKDAEEQMYKNIGIEFGKAAVGEVRALVTQMRKERQTLDHEFQRMRAEERLTWILIFLFAGIIYGIFKITGVW